MKLKNKKTGEIVDLSEGVITDTYGGEKIQIKPVAISNNEGYVYSSLAELNAEWEDAPEGPKKYWFINASGEINSIYEEDEEEEDTKSCKEIGNYFETEEEAEKAVEKLKAWKRLKDKGFRFTGVAGISNNIYVSFETDSNYRGGHVMYDEHSNTDNKLKEYNEDLALLFGGEEC